MTVKEQISVTKSTETNFKEKKNSAEKFNSFPQKKNEKNEFCFSKFNLFYLESEKLIKIR